jgi:hypothetical protein
MKHLELNQGKDLILTCPIAILTHSNRSVRILSKTQGNYLRSLTLANKFLLPHLADVVRASRDPKFLISRHGINIVFNRETFIERQPNHHRK